MADSKEMSGEGLMDGQDTDPVVPRAVAVFGSFRFGPYYDDLIAGVVAAAEAVGSSVIAVQTAVGVSPFNPDDPAQRHVTRAGWDRFDGAIVVLHAVSRDYVADLRAAGKFVVAVGQDIRGTHAAITLDNAGGVRSGVTHLVEHGHKAIGFVAPTWHADADERYRAYADCMRMLDLDALPVMGHDLPAELTMEDQGYLAAQAFIDAGRPCSAVMLATDLLAFGFIRGLRDAGLSVPGDVAVVGVDDFDESAVHDPPLATVAISFHKVGEIACNVALRGGSGEAMEERYYVPQRFVPRESCGCLHGAESDGAGWSDTPIATLVDTLVEAAQEDALEGSVDRNHVVEVAGRVATLLNPPADGSVAVPSVESVADEINKLCVIDRSVQAARRAIRDLAQALVNDSEDPVERAKVPLVALDLYDAIWAGQLQRRLTVHSALKRAQINHYFIGTSLLGRDRGDLRSLSWLAQTDAQAGALGLWEPGLPGRIAVHGIYNQDRQDPASITLPQSDVPVESFPPTWMLRDASGVGRLVVLTQIRFEDSDWGVLAVAGGPVLQSSVIQETFLQWSLLMSASLDQEKANADLDRQAGELTAAYETEVALLEEVRVSEERYALAAEAAHDALWDWDIASNKIFYSSRWKALLGFRDNEIGPAPEEWFGRVHPDDRQAVQAQLDQALKGVEQFLDFEHRLRVSTGEHRWIACSGRSVSDKDGRPIRLVGSISDVTVRRLLQEQLLQEAMFDGLTGLAKGTLFKDRLNQAIELSKRRPDYWFAVLFVDLDGFKAVNDRWGHAAGDEVLAGVANRLKDSLRTNDTAARLGGDEFAILLNDVGHVSELPLIIERLEALIRVPHTLGNHAVSVGAAIGYAVSGAEATADAMLHEADTSMYRAKRRSRGISVKPVAKAH